MALPLMSAPARTDGYAPIRDYAVIGNKRTAALVALDGAIDWLALPAFNGPSVFGALLDARRGGRCTLAPSVPFGATREYLEGTNVLQTTFETAGGVLRVTDAMSRPAAHALLWNQVIRRVEVVAGEVPVAWSVEPRFDYGAGPGRAARHAGVPVFERGPDIVAVEAHGLGEADQRADAVVGERTLHAGDSGVLAVSGFHAEPLTFSSREHLDRALDATAARWRAWIGECDYDGPWHKAVLRSALALDLLVDDENGAITAAVTMALPERVGGDRNYDYRYTWLRDANLTLEAMLALGYRDQVHLSLGWMLRALRSIGPRLRPMLRLDASPNVGCVELDLEGYRGSRPVLAGNIADEQLQLGNYGDVFDMTLKYVEDGHALTPGDAQMLADAADFLCRVWRRPDSGIWELPEKRLYTQSRIACWVALDRAARLAARDALPGDAGRWRREADRIAAYIQRHCWSQRIGAYALAAGGDGLDAAVLLPSRRSFLEEEPERLDGTIAAIRERLGAGGPLLYRYSGMQDVEGAFVACSFWMVQALARRGRLDEATEMMDAMVDLANDVGLYAEEIDPGSHAFLGNLPQALSHLALVNAAVELRDAARA